MRADLFALQGLPGERMLLLSLGSRNASAGWGGAAGIDIEADEEIGGWFARVTALATAGDGTPMPAASNALARAVAKALRIAMTAIRSG